MMRCPVCMATCRDDAIQGRAVRFRLMTVVRLKRNSLSGKNYLPRRSARSGRVPAHIGEALAARPWVIPREVLGTPSDPVTTDPKGEAGPSAARRRIERDLQHAGPHQYKAAYGMLSTGSKSGSMEARASAGRSDKGSSGWRTAPKGADEVKG